MTLCTGLQQILSRPLPGFKLGDALRHMVRFLGGPVQRQKLDSEGTRKDHQLGIFYDSMK